MTTQHRCLAGCGKAITWRFAICSDCEKVYGRRPANWPGWLHFLWKDIQAERRRMVRQQRWEIMTDIELLEGSND